jgi:tetratricopeptide repeat protein
MSRRPRVVGGAIVAVALGVAGLQRQFAGPGYESALLAGVVCPSVAAIVTAVELRKSAPAPFDGFCHGVANGVAAVMLAWAVAFLHGLRVGLCDLVDGTVFFALGPGIGAVLGGVWGAIAAELTRRFSSARIAPLVAFAAPVCTAAFGLLLFYATPVIFDFDPFAGFFSGALYDTVLDSSGLLTYRAGSAATLVAAYVAALHLERRDERLRFRSLGRPGLVALGALAAVASITMVCFGARLGHWQTAGTIAAELGGETVAGHCRVLHPRTIDRAHAARFAADCNGHVTAITAWLELPAAPDVTVYLFADAAQKRRLMGAAQTSIAKPWRKEAYVQDEAYPHPVVGHELVHVLTSEIGRGPFRVAGDLGGLLPSPGLIEGIAEAGAPRDDDLGVHEWAAAMRQIGVLPKLDDLIGLAFFGSAASTSYTAAGSFVEHVREEHGIDTVKRWYGGEDLAAVVGKSWDELERAWWERLDGIAIGDAELATAKARFDRPSVLERPCPHAVDAELVEAQSLLGAGDTAGALARYRHVLSLDPASQTAMFGIARCHDRAGDPDAATASLDEVAVSELVPLAVRARAMEERGDLALRAGDAAAARKLYGDAAAVTVGDPQLRTLDLKARYADHPLGRPAFVALLIGATAEGPSQEQALELLGRWREADPTDGTPDYLFGRQLFNAARYAPAAERLDAALAKAIDVPRAANETLRLRIVSACALGDGAGAREALAKYVTQPMVLPQRARYAAALVARCGG